VWTEELATKLSSTIHWVATLYTNCRAMSLGAMARFISCHVTHRSPSSDGAVILFGDTLSTDQEWFYTLQATTSVPSVLPWATVVGQAYRLTASPTAPDLRQTSISFSYLGSDVPPGEEPWLRVYFWDGVTWKPLTTDLKPRRKYCVGISARIRNLRPHVQHCNPASRPGMELIRLPDS